MREGFTLLELMLAVSILAVVTGVTYMSFSIVINAWKRGMVLSDDLHHGDFVMEQLVSGLRSAYYKDMRHGFHHEDTGDDPYSSDIVSWTKLGGGLLGKDYQFAESPHRVKFSVEEDDGGQKLVTVRAWRAHGQLDDFDPDELEPVFLSRRVTGFNCRLRDPEAEGEDSDEIRWLDEWEDTNKVPATVEITLYLEPLGKNEDPVEIKRIVTIPVVAQTAR